MPTYAYHCDTGNHDFDIVQKFSEDALTVCPQCGGSVRRVIQPVGVVFKGSGWYINDSRKGSGSESKREKSSDKSEATADKSAADKSAGDKGAGDKSTGEKSGSDKPAGDKAAPKAEKATAKAAD